MKRFGLEGSLKQPHVVGLPDAGTPIKHIVALSGGKDSTAMALWLSENEPRDYIFVCTPTQDELPEMVAHWQKLEGLLCAPLHRITTLSLKANNFRHGSLPNWRMRFCTGDLKIKPYIALMLKMAPAVSYVGLRADEVGRQGTNYGKAGGEVYGVVDGIEQRFPLRELGWGVREVLGYLEEKGVTIPKRTDCARCFFQRLIEWYELWRDYPAIYADAEAEEDHYGHTYRSDSRDTWPAALKDLRKEFESGKVPKDTRERTMMCRVCSL